MEYLLRWPSPWSGAKDGFNYVRNPPVFVDHLLLKEDVDYRMVDVCPQSDCPSAGRGCAVFSEEASQRALNAAPASPWSGWKLERVPFEGPAGLNSPSEFAYFYVYKS